jgi:sulfate adenylyltransferase subunit 1 (EFTu-like GTPase family)
MEILPSGFTAKILSINTSKGKIEEASAPVSVKINLTNDLDIRSDMNVISHNQPKPDQHIDIITCCLNRGRQIQEQNTY